MQKYRMDKRNDINEFRKKRRLRRVRLNIAILVLFGLIALFIALNWGKIIAPLKDAALDVGKGGFPVDLPGSTDYVLDELGDNFCLLTDTYFYTYNSDGAMITSAQHGLQSPALSSNSRRALIYDRNGRELQLYNRSGEIFSTATEDTIDFAQVSNGERSAVVKIFQLSVRFQRGGSADIPLGFAAVPHRPGGVLAGRQQHFRGGLRRGQRRAGVQAAALRP